MPNKEIEINGTFGATLMKNHCQKDYFLKKILLRERSSRFIHAFINSAIGGKGFVLDKTSFWWPIDR